MKYRIDRLVYRVSFLKHHGVMVILFVSLSLLYGCGQPVLDDLVQVTQAPYAQVDRLTTTVMRGNLTPVYEGEIQLCGYEETAYRVGDDLLRNLDAGYEAKVKALHVQTGDHVKKGDVMLSFTSEILEERLADKEKTKRHAELGIEHYEKMHDIDILSNYSFEIGDLKDDIALSKVYIDDVNKIYDQLNIKAEKDGIVTFVDPSVMNGFLTFGKPLFKVVSDSGYYMAQPWQKGVGDDSLEKISFTVGERFHAKSRIAEYEVEVIADPEKAGGTGQSGKQAGSVSENSMETAGDNIAGSISNNSAGQAEQPDVSRKDLENDKVYFKIVGGSDRISEQTLTIYKNMEEIKNVCYVETAALIQHEDSFDIFAYKQTPDGIFVPVQVEVGNVVGEYAVITDGLTEGDVISIPPDTDYRDEIRANSKKRIIKEVAVRDGATIQVNDDNTITIDDGKVKTVFDLRLMDELIQTEQ